MATGDGNGPSYWDVGAWYTHTVDRWGRFIKFEVTPPLRVRTTQEMHRAIVVLYSAPRSNPAAWHRERAMSFGRGGDAATLPGAMLRLCLACEARWAEDEARAEAQLTF